MDLLASRMILNAKSQQSKKLKRLSQSQAHGFKKKPGHRLLTEADDDTTTHIIARKQSSDDTSNRKKAVKKKSVNQCTEIASSPGKFAKLLPYPKPKQTLSNSLKCRRKDLLHQVDDDRKIPTDASKQSKKNIKDSKISLRSSTSKTEVIKYKQSCDEGSNTTCLIKHATKGKPTKNIRAVQQRNKIMESKVKKRRLSTLSPNCDAENFLESNEERTNTSVMENTTIECSDVGKDKKVSPKSIKASKKSLQTKSDKSSTLDGHLSREKIMSYVRALQKLVQKDENGKKSLFDSNKPPIFLQLNCIKIPKTPMHQLRITLPHSILSSDDDIALFVKDLKRGRKRDYEDTVQFYEDLLQNHGCTRVKTIIPMNQVKTEYRQFEMRRRLFKSYDHFLVDGRIAGHIAHLLGKHFRQKRKLPTSIHMDKKDLLKEIDSALKKTSLQIHGNGDDSVVQIGAFTMNVEEITDNIFAVLENLKVNFPGGWNNLRSIRIKTPSSLSIPIYTSLRNKNDVETPVVEPKRPKAYKIVEGELSTFTSNVNVIVSPDGTVALRKIDDESDVESAAQEHCSIESANDVSNDSDESDENDG
ncbi:hypothetical protein QAD02_022111 [Eretmocerus hayati]|uniref:Uncharacterized protein n=1 Tax=Eretmocerus hayati TaxID=131215 RepID=A0ACC2PSC4_9HYME|nr:hypothetical protein QAD02_022111 [Eretmocerus hayati]